MTRQRPPELFGTERPIQSDFGRAHAPRRLESEIEKTYARRRKITVGLLLLIMCGGAYAAWGHRPRNPADIPTIHAEGPYKQKPADPGGIDIPHQDVRVYDQLEGRNAAAPAVEHLLPPPEIPVAQAPTVKLMPAPNVAPVSPVEVAPPPAPTPPAPQKDAILPEPPHKIVATTVTPAPVPVAPVTPAPAPTLAARQDMTIDQVIADTKAEAKAQITAPAKTPAASGSISIQLASSNDQNKAQAMMQELQKKYASQLGDATLHLARADLGSKGIFYRIQSQGLDESDASHICSALKQAKAGCILVRK